MDITSLAITIIAIILTAFISRVIFRKGYVQDDNLSDLRDQLNSFKTKYEISDNRVKELELELDNLEKDFKEVIESRAKLEATNENLQQKISEDKKELDNLQNKFKEQFENLANKIFEDKSNKFEQQSQKSLKDILTPVKEQFMNFEKKVNESFGNQAKEQFALKEEIKRIVAVNEKMTLQTESLTKALKSDVKTQGNWGEVILEKILEDSGLRKNIDYILQGAGLDLKYEASGSTQKPDVIVMLPDEKHIIIDAKVSLTDYEKYWTAETDEDRQKHVKSFTNSIKKHVKGLEERKYQSNDKLGTPDFVLMFMPVEGAYALAVQSDRELHSYAWDKKVVIVGPSTLFATLRTISSIWKLELQNQNANEIARQGGALYDKIAGFVDDMQKLGNQMETTSRTYNSAMKKLSEGNGNILKRSETLKALGLKTDKKIAKLKISSEIESEDSAQTLEAEEKTS
jgi:DNA recombination protein RmuC